jgi:hypothetical protein
VEPFLAFSLSFLSEDEELGNEITNGLQKAPKWLLHRIADQIVQWCDYVSSQRSGDGIKSILNNVEHDVLLRDPEVAGQVSNKPPSSASDTTSEIRASFLSDEISSIIKSARKSSKPVAVTSESAKSLKKEKIDFLRAAKEWAANNNYGAEYRSSKDTVKFSTAPSSSPKRQQKARTTNIPSQNNRPSTSPSPRTATTGILDRLYKDGMTQIEKKKKKEMEVRGIHFCV